jgi:hypothetical protein
MNWYTHTFDPGILAVGMVAALISLPFLVFILLPIWCVFLLSSSLWQRR